jgi:hypothetical protein
MIVTFCDIYPREEHRFWSRVLRRIFYLGEKVKVKIKLSLCFN